MKRNFLIALLFLFITSLFFYPIFKGNIPFPGDLLVGGYEPYKSYSHLGYAPGGVPNKAQGADVIRESFPWKFFTVESFKRGDIPFWTPYNFSGNPIMANFQSAVFYPLNVIFFLLPFIQAWTIFIFMAPFLAAFFNYLFLRELKLSRVASLLGGIVFGFSSYMVVWLQYGNITHTFLWLPLALLFTERLIKKQTIINFLSIMVVLFISLLGGYIQGYFYIISIIIFYFLLKVVKNKNSLKTVVVFSLALLFPVFFSLFQILPTLELFKYSSRGNYSLDQIHQMLNPLWYVITVIAPDFFGHPATRTNWFHNTYIESVSYFGLIPFVLAICSLFFVKKRIEIKIFGVIFIITFLLALDLILNRYLYLIPLPVLSTTIPTRILSIFQFSGAVLAAFGLDYLLQKNNKKLFLVTSLSIIAILIGAMLVTLISPKLLTDPQWILQMNIAKRSLILPLFYIVMFTVIISLYFYFKKVSRIAGISLIVSVVFIVISIADLFYFFHKITPFSPKEFIYPQTRIINFIKEEAGINRYWGFGSAYVSSNFQNYDKTYSPEGDDPLHIKEYTELVEAAGNKGVIPSSIPRVNSNIPSGYGDEELSKKQDRQRVMDIIGVKYVLNKDESLGSEYRANTGLFDNKMYELVWQDNPWQVYENKKSLPRAFLAFNYQIIDKEKMIKKIFDKNFNPRETILLEEEIPIKLGKDSEASVAIEEYLPNKIVLRTSSTANGLLFLSDNFYPGWTVTIDGKHGKVYRADYTFRAVPVEKGQHKVVFWYNPQSFIIGIKLSILSVFLLALSVVILKRKKILV